MKADVAVVGFGPVGASLAGLLAQRGIKVIVLERDKDVFPHPRAAHVDHTGLRLLQELGCLEEAQARMIRNTSLDLVDAQYRLLARVQADQKTVSGLPASMYFYQPEFDRLLRRTVEEMPDAEVRIGEEMTHFEPSDGGVVLHTKAADGVERFYRADWLVGCDGAWSPIREGSRIKLASLNFDEQWIVLDLKLKEPQPNLPSDRVVQVCDPARPHLTTPIAKDRQRFEFMLLPGEDPAEMQTPKRVTELLAAWLPSSAFEIERSAIYTFHGLVAEQWCKGRVLIAGDAAHQMPPFLGQGMCSGLRDAANLAWKLDLVIRKRALPSILETYQSERGPHVRGVVESAVQFGQIVCELDPERAAERDRKLLGEAPNSRSISFTLPRLKRGPLVLEGGGALFVQPVIGGEPLDNIVDKRFLVLGRNREALGRTASWWEEHMGALVTTLADLGDDPVLRQWLDRDRADVVVVRPDRYILGAARNLDDITRELPDYFDLPGHKVQRDAAL